MSVADRHSKAAVNLGHWASIWLGPHIVSFAATVASASQAVMLGP